MLHLLIVHHLLLVSNSILLGDPLTLHIYRYLLNHLILHRMWRNLVSNVLDLIIAQVISQLSVLISIIWNHGLLRIIHLVCNVHTKIALLWWVSVLSNWCILISETLAPLSLRAIVPLSSISMKAIRSYIHSRVLISPWLIVHNLIELLISHLLLDTTWFFQSLPVLAYFIILLQSGTSPSAIKTTISLSFISSIATFVHIFNFLF